MDEDSTILFNDLHILSFTALRNYKVACLVHKILYTNFQLLNIMFNFPRANTRQTSPLNLNLPPRNIVYGEGLLDFFEAQTWNTVPHKKKNYAYLKPFLQTVFLV